MDKDRPTQEINMKTLIVVLLSIGLRVEAQTNLVTLTNNAGEVFKNVQIVRVDPDGIIYRAVGAAGGGQIKFTALPEAIQRQYNYDPAVAAKAVAAKKAADEKASAARGNAAAAELRAQRDTLIRQKVIAGAFKDYLKVIQKTDGGLLVSDSYGDGTRPDIFFLTDYPGSVVDDDMIRVTTYHYGEYTYTSVQGAQKTVNRLTCSLEQAVDYAIRLEDLKY